MEEILYRIPGRFDVELPVGANLDEAKRDWAWRFMEGSDDFAAVEGVTRYGVIDTGYDKNHPDFKGAVVAERDFTRSRGGVQDGNGHGTWCAGCIGAREDGQHGIGVDPKCELVIAKALDDRGSGRGDWIAAAIRWCADEGCEVLSLSLGSPNPDFRMGEAVDYFLERQPLGLVIVAAGNSGPGTDSWLATLKSTTSVGSMRKDGRISDYSSRNGLGSVDILGPGEDVIASWPMPAGHATLSGTSMATPFCAGLGGRWKRRNPSGGQTAFRAALKASSSDYGQPGYDNESGWGIIDPAKLLAGEATRPVEPNDEGLVVRFRGAQVVA